MQAVLGGLGAALAFAVATVCSARSSRMLGPWSVVAWVMLVGALIAVPLALSAGIPAELDARNGAWLAVSGCGNVGGLLLAYTALRSGKVVIVAPIVSTEGAVTAAMSVAAGERLPAVALVLLVVIVVGVAVAAVGDEPHGKSTQPLRSSLLAGAAALAFGVSLYATGHVAQNLPVPWVMLPARVVGVLAVAVPLGLSGRLRLVRAAVPLVVVSGTCEVLGFASFALGARHDIAISAVLASLFSVFAAVGGVVVFGERLSRRQCAGVVTVVVAVTALSAVR